MGCMAGGSIGLYSTGPDKSPQEIAVCSMLPTVAKRDQVYLKDILDCNLLHSCQVYPLSCLGTTVTLIEVRLVSGHDYLVDLSLWAPSLGSLPASSLFGCFDVWALILRWYNNGYVTGSEPMVFILALHASRAALLGRCVLAGTPCQSPPPARRYENRLLLSCHCGRQSQGAPVGG